jgi:proteasome lid subunit RPN8/RPN11
MDIYIYDVKETGKDNWEVDFWTKEPSDAEYDKSTYQFATVEKEKSGSYIGYIFHSSPLQLGDETY